MGGNEVNFCAKLNDYLIFAVANNTKSEIANAANPKMANNFPAVNISSLFVVFPKRMRINPSANASAGNPTAVTMIRKLIGGLIFNLINRFRRGIYKSPAI